MDIKSIILLGVCILATSIYLYQKNVVKPVNKEQKDGKRKKL